MRTTIQDEQDLIEHDEGIDGFGGTPARFVATYPFKRRPGAYMMPNPGVPSYYGNPYGNPYGVPIGNYDPSWLTLGKLAIGVTLLQNLGKQPLLNVVGGYLVWTGGQEALDSREVAAVLPPIIPAAETAGLMEDFQAASNTQKAVALAAVGAAIWGLTSKKSPIRGFIAGEKKRKRKTRKNRRNRARNRRRNTQRRNVMRNRRLNRRRRNRARARR